MPPAIDAAPRIVREPTQPPTKGDVLDELAHVQLDPRAVEERRSADRFGGTILLLIGCGVLALAVSFDVQAIVGSEVAPLKLMLLLHVVGVGALGYGIGKLRSRGESPDDD